MKGISLTFEEKCVCAEDEFCYFVVNSDNFESHEKDYLRGKILDNQITGFLYVSSVLVGWSVVAAWLDSILIPGTVLYSLLEGKITWQIAAPAIIFLSVNISLKFFYIKYSLGNRISIPLAFISVLPYIGSVILIRDQLKGDMLLQKGVIHFLKDRKKMAQKQILDKLKNIFMFWKK
ncbi:hypothetical protein [Aureibacter tunicatorum]|uniref:Uncharacterized protein n=1 Tax=Aureibacter tunicatorum TaxID=866807 RepID=A0AAE4BRT6_9BACT|nr:hypothetical protein [Aureibacter tunicatorum]MDR6238228.1 hypothetical protein [Aureibacter tunicatorum]BDD03261.1 hypothetical protein AUTU_07440 [Aureibacter tunicatorum]